MNEESKGEVGEKDTLGFMSASFHIEQCIPHISHVWPVRETDSNLKASVSYCPEQKD